MQGFLGSAGRLGLDTLLCAWVPEPHWQLRALQAAGFRSLQTPLMRWHWVSCCVQGSPNPSGAPVIAALLHAKVSEPHKCTGTGTAVGHKDPQVSPEHQGWVHFCVQGP